MKYLKDNIVTPIGGHMKNPGVAGGEGEYVSLTALIEELKGGIKGASEKIETGDVIESLTEGGIFDNGVIDGDGTTIPIGDYGIPKSKKLGVEAKILNYIHTIIPRENNSK